jgi:hypothetical protein
MRPGKPLFQSFAVIAVVVLAAAASQATSWYVSTTGSDALDSGQTAAAPFAAIQHAVDSSGHRHAARRIDTGIPLAMSGGLSPCVRRGAAVQSREVIGSH